MCGAGRASQPPLKPLAPHTATQSTVNPLTTQTGRRMTVESPGHLLPAEDAREGNCTTGSWATEADAAAALDAVLEQAGLWTIYREVPGVLSQPRPSQPGKTLRIDRVLVPAQRLIALGWAHGSIGVEIKRSGIKLGEPIAQAMDYSRAVWTLPVGGIRVWLDWVFIWPMPKQNGITASILTQNRIGSASADSWTLLQLKCGEHNLIKIGTDGIPSIGTAPATGQKAGSR